MFSAHSVFSLNAPGSLPGRWRCESEQPERYHHQWFYRHGRQSDNEWPVPWLNSALIYAGNNLKLFTDRLHNQHGDIPGRQQSVGTEGQQRYGNSEIINRSGNIETTRGDITMNTAHLLNSWDAISASHEVIPGSSHG